MKKKLSTKLHNEESIALGENLRARRKEMDLTQQQVALVLGCSPQQVQKYETGRTKITMPIFLKLCQTLHTHPNRFFTCFALSEDSIRDKDFDLEKKLLEAFRSVANENVKKRIVNLVEALVATA